MMRSYLLIAATAAVASALDDINTKPDALDTDFLKSLPNPVVNLIPGLLEHTISFDTDAAVVTAAAEVDETPLSVFPAATSVPINAAGEDGGAQRRATSTQQRAVPEQLAARDACGPEPIISNIYNIDVSSYASFMADPKIASIASGAATPSGYVQSFKNLYGATSASAYMGYTVLTTGYDVDACARQCDEQSGCLAFNIFFERSPMVSPGPGCENPAAFANIMCSFWGVPLDKTTATYKGSYREEFQVGIAGSTAYTVVTVGRPVDGYVSPPSDLGKASMQAPLRDCGGTWTYMGYKIYQDQPFDPRLCGAACDAQTEYNIAHPPSTGKAAKCGAFGTYLVQKTTSSGTWILGQMCTLYTSTYNATLATNTGRTDPDRTQWTISASFFYSRADRQPICSSSIEYLKAEGQEFCSSFISYSAPSVTILTSATPTNKAIITATLTVTVNTGSPTTTFTGNANWKRGGKFARQEGPSSSEPLSAAAPEPTAAPSSTTNHEHLDVEVSAIANLGPSTIAVLTDVVTQALPSNGTTPRFARRAVATPTSIADWPTSRISEACSDVAAGTVTVVRTQFAASLTTTTTALASTTIAACIIPSQQAEYKNLIPIWGAWDAAGASPGLNPNGQYGRVAAVQLPFPYCAYGVCTNVISVSTDGAFFFTNPANSAERITMNVYQGTGQYLYPGQTHGVYTRITGAQGSRQFTISWYAATFQWNHAMMHVTATWYENAPNTVYYKYYDAVQVYTNIHSISKGNTLTRVWPAGYMKAGTQIRIDTTPGSDGAATFAATQRNRIDCCTIQDGTAAPNGSPRPSEKKSKKRNRDRGELVVNALALSVVTSWARGGAEALSSKRGITSALCM
ncbi:uncharacterized protein B0I36DRAFT_347865 [Microdochium trichocladiopsis]|uniref:Uncharacterized protein n=1 Tax=Microdochium trichocladiopsis TaxID=1682393 RepID=A0A9P8YAA4_9PEZI|nr:uncharacterized protein B0I36DRAFT_347865 [Microdochium trichocladiopsis]KAH7032684.1 hypothetical protein B0I36DRAFT_347865 [Microdochium trichocladiopsis]